MTRDKRARTHDRAPTWTTQLADALGRVDDFMTMRQLSLCTGATTSQACAALHHLKSVRVVDSVESGGALWWFLTGDDARSRILEERAVEEPGSRIRRCTCKEKRP